MKNKVLLLVGTWKLFGGKGDGIHIFEQDPLTGTLFELSQVTSTGNTSMLCITRDGRFVYAVDERKDLDGVYGRGGGVEAFSIDQNTMKLTSLNKQPSLGSCPSFVCVDNDSRFIAVSNHGTNPCMATTVVQNSDKTYAVRRIPDDSSVALFPISNNGTIMPCSSIFISRGPDLEQPAHCHSVAFSPNGKLLFSCDKGLSRIYIFRIDKEQGELVQMPGSPYICRHNSRTRHMAFHPFLPILFTSNEYEYSVTSYMCDFKSGQIHEVCTKSTDVDKFIAGRQLFPGTVDVRVHPNGRFIYVSNRTTNNGITSISINPINSEYENGTISIFSLTDEYGHMRLICRHPLRCGNPRSFELSPDGCFLYVAELDRDNITRYSINSKTGLLSDEMVVANIPSPSHLVFYNKSVKDCMKG